MKKIKSKKRFVSFLVSVVATLTVITAAMLIAEGFMGGESGENIVFKIESGSGTREIAESLKENGIINHPFIFRVISKLSNTDGKYLEGEYNMSSNMGYGRILKKLTSPPDVLDNITIPEGYEFRQIADLLSEKGLVDRDKFIDVANNYDFDYDFLKNIPEREYRLEGYLFPDTYSFDENSTEVTIIDTMLKKFDEVFSYEYKQRADKMGMSVDDIVTLASVIEREAGGDEDRDKVSSVFHNRLKSKEYPYLESCATVQYILKERKDVLSSKDTRIKSPYNTYINPGLPIGPIASPGEKSIKAALYPADTDYLFFVCGSDGKHKFAKTFDEHIENEKNK